MVVFLGPRSSLKGGEVEAALFVVSVRAGGWLIGVLAEDVGDDVQVLP